MILATCEWYDHQNPAKKRAAPIQRFSAVLNILTQTRYKTLTTESKNLIKGYYGKTPAPIAKELIQKIQAEGEEIITERPADKLQPELQKAIEESRDFAKSPTDIISYAIFGSIAKTFLIERNENRLTPEALTTFEDDHRPMPKDFMINLHGESYHIKVEGSGAKDEEIRPFFVRINGDLREVFVVSNEDNTKKESIKNGDSLPQASLPGHIISPMPGNLTKLKVKVGDNIKEGDVVAIVEAMKMENQVLATKGGEVKEIYAREGQQISANLAIMLVE